MSGSRRGTRPAKKAEASEVAGFDVFKWATRDLVEEVHRTLRSPTPLGADAIERLLDARPAGVALVVERFLGRAGLSSGEIGAMSKHRLDGFARALLGTLGTDHALAMIVAAEDELEADAPRREPVH